MLFLITFAEILITAAIFIPLAIFAPTLLVLVLSAAWIVFLYFFRPARRISFRIRGKNRVVRRVYRTVPVPHDVCTRPDEKLTPAEVFRLMEIIGEVPAERSAVADFTATLLDLNRRGFLLLETGFCGELFSSEDIRIVFSPNTNARLRRHERLFLKLLRSAGPSKSPFLGLPSFLEYTERATGAMQRKTDRFRRAVDLSLLKHGLLRDVPVKPKAKNAFARFFAGRMLILTEKGELSAALWRVYLKNSAEDPQIPSYVPASPSMKPNFANDAFRLLTDTATVGLCAKAAQALSRGFIFEPHDLWNEKLYFSTLSESRTAFSESRNGEAYFFLPLRDFETAIRLAVTYGSPQSTPKRV